MGPRTLRVNTKNTQVVDNELRLKMQLNVVKLQQSILMRMQANNTSAIYIAGFYHHATNEHFLYRSV